MNPDNIVLRAAAWIVPLVIAIVFHEVAHGWAARFLGDPTARDLRRLSFNPIRHVDPVGTVLLPLGLAVAGAPVFGWAKPVPVDARRLRDPRWGMVLVALAGPGMNLALALVAAIAIGLIGPVAGGGAVGAFVFANLFNFILVNVTLGLFNLLPIPPLDGSHVLEGVLPRPLAFHYAKLARYGLLIVILLIVVVPMVFKVNPLASIIVPPAQGLVAALLGVAAAL